MACVIFCPQMAILEKDDLDIWLFLMRKRYIVLRETCLISVLVVICLLVWPVAYKADAMKHWNAVAVTC